MKLLTFLLLSILTFALFVGFTYFFRSRIIAPGVMALAGGFAWIYLMSWRSLLLLIRYREGLPKVLIIGTDGVAQEWADRARRGEFGAVMLIGYTCWNAARAGEVVDELPVLGPAGETDGWLRRWRAKRVVLSLSSAQRRTMISVLEKKPLKRVQVTLVDESLFWGAGSGVK